MLSPNVVPWITAWGRSLQGDEGIDRLHCKFPLQFGYCTLLSGGLLYSCDKQLHVFVLTKELNAGMSVRQLRSKGSGVKGDVGKEEKQKEEVKEKRRGQQ
jgi:hypothetical protein